MDAVRFLQELSRKRLFASAIEKQRLIQRLAEETGLLPYPIPIILLTGTCGKGSTAMFLSSILENHGYRVGSIQSPHLLSFNERIQINRTPMNEEKIVSKLEQLLPHFLNAVQPTADNPYGALNYNQVFLVVGLQLFLEESIDFVIVESGIGGYNDPSSFFTPILSIITNVFKDHESVLGNTLEEIAYDKSGVIKKGIPVITGCRHPSPLQVIEREAADKAAPLYRLGREFLLSSDEEMGTAEYREPNRRLSYSLSAAGAFQLENAAIAIKAAYLLQEMGYPVQEEKIKHALLHTALPGRFQIIRREPLIVIDGAHNEEEIRQFCETVRKFGCKRHYMIIGISGDKQISEMLSWFQSLPCEYLLVQHSNSLRAKSPEEICHLLQEQGQTALSFENLEEAFHYAEAKAGQEDGIFFTGSMFLAGDALSLLAGS